MANAEVWGELVGKGGVQSRAVEARERRQMAGIWRGKEEEGRKRGGGGLERKGRRDERGWRGGGVERGEKGGRWLEEEGGEGEKGGVRTEDGS